jgi:hypothetical protein
MLRRPLALLAIAACACALADTARAAAPRYVMVSGSGLARPVMLASWRENLALETAIARAPHATAPAGVSARPRLRLSLFWGWGEHRPQWPGQANQRGWLYPATASQPAVVALRVDGSAALRVATAELLRILSRHGVPTGSAGAGS